MSAWWLLVPLGIWGLVMMIAYKERDPADDYDM